MALTSCDFSNALWGPIYNAATGNQTDCQVQAQIEENQQGVQDVADNAVKYGELDPETAQAIADENKTAVASETAGIAQQNNSQCATTLPLIGCVKDWSDFLTKAKQDLVYLFVGLVVLVLFIAWAERKIGL